MSGTEDSLLDAFSKEFPVIGLPGGVSPFLDDAAPMPEPAKPASPPEEISHFPPSSMLPPAGGAVRLPPVAALVEPSDSISGLSLTGLVGDDPYAAMRASARPDVAAASAANDPLAKLNAIQLTGTDHFQGRMVENYIGPLDAHVIVSMESLFAGDSPQGRFGRFKGAQMHMKQLTELLLLELRNEAQKRGADAVLRVSVEKVALGNTISFTAVGTAVRLASA
jgi:uncharacterized protein YbjQ (UPF0145 family)